MTLLCAVKWLLLHESSCSFFFFFFFFQNGLGRFCLIFLLSRLSNYYGMQAVFGLSDISRFRKQPMNVPFRPSGFQWKIVVFLTFILFYFIFFSFCFFRIEMWWCIDLFADLGDNNRSQSRSSSHPLTVCFFIFVRSVDRSINSLFINSSD